MFFLNIIIICVIASFIVLLLSMVLALVHLEHLDLLPQVSYQSLANCIPLLLGHGKR